MLKSLVRLAITEANRRHTVTVAQLRCPIVVTRTRISPKAKPATAVIAVRALVVAVVERTAVVHAEVRQA